MFKARSDGRPGIVTRGALFCVAVAGCAFAVAAIGAETSTNPVAPESPASRVAQALAYEHGEGVAKDQLKAAALYCEAARDGDPEAQYNLGWMYANGRGVPRDDAVAASFFALAAASGHAGATKALAFVGEARGPLPGCIHRPDPSPATEEPPDAADPFAELPGWKRKIADEVAKLAPRYDVDTRLA